MNKIFFALGLLLASSAFAATGTGHAQAELLNPLALENVWSINFGTIAIDPAAGPQTVSMSNVGAMTCPATYICGGTPNQALIKITGAPSTVVNVSLVGATAILDDGSGNQLTFDPIQMSTGVTTSSEGNTTFGLGGSITFTGNEIAGTYSSLNTGGSGYTVTFNY